VLVIYRDGLLLDSSPTGTGSRNHELLMASLTPYRYAIKAGLPPLPLPPPPPLLLLLLCAGISFTPREVGDHWVSVYRSGQPIAGSPFKVSVGQSEIGNASKVRAGGRGLTQGMANELNEFFINTRDAGPSLV